ncbi:MAG: bifunctional DNA-formamidopyrimidine glycosylase/DNA-(apurinic or apyrimidinic site) lyase [Acidobacteriota bacterium]
MPELPEVETIARGLAPLLRGAVLEGLTVLDRRAFPGDRAAFLRELAGRRIEAVSRRGKLCILEMEGGGAVAFHLRMTGRLYVPEPGAPHERHLRLILHLADGRGLHFSDTRRFGSCHGFGPGGIGKWDFYASLGPEPLALSDEGFDAALGASKSNIKALLLNQHVVAGIGNIYADEALFLAGIRPQARADSLDATRRKALLAALKDVLSRAIAAGGSTIRDYRTAHGVEGAFQWDFKVYGRAGQPCAVCGTKLEGGRVAGRATVFCPACQR